jgi:gamma-aminobutyric acid type B receptor
VLALSLVLHALLFRFRARPEVKGSSVAYCHVMATGPVLACVAVMLIAQFEHASDANGDGICAAAPILFSLGFNFIFGSAFLKTYRIHKIFSLKSMQVQKLSRTLLSSSVALNSWDLLVFIVWLATDRFHRILAVPNSSVPNVFAYTCQSKSTTLWVLLLCLPKAFLLVASIYLAFSVRTVASNFNESKFLGFRSAQHRHDG